MKTFGWLVGAAALVTLVGARGQSGENLKGITARGLQGNYRIVSGEKDGKAVPKGEIDGAEVHITPEMIISFDKDRKQTYAAKIKVDGTRDPAVIHMVSTLPKEGLKADGLVTREGDRVKLIYALPGGKAPTGFKTGERQLMFVLEMINKDKK